MKNVIFIYLIFFSLGLCAQEKAVWDYPVKPGMEEWNRLKTEKERIAAVQIPENVLVRLSADETVKLCVSFPLFGYYTAFNSPQDGFQIMLSRFNIFQPVLSMKGVGKGLITVYKDADMSGFRKLSYSNDYWTIKLEYLEIVLSRKEVLQSMTAADRLDLLLETRKKYSEKMQSESFSSIPALQATTQIMARILEVEEYAEFKNYSNYQMMDRYIKTGIAEDAALINDVVKMTDNFIKKSK